MQVSSYQVENNISKEQKFVYFDEAFFDFIAEEFKKTNVSQLSTEMRNCLHEQIIEKLLPEHFASLPFLLSRIIKLASGKFEIRVLANPEIFSVVVDLDISQDTIKVTPPAETSFKISRVQQVLPRDLDPENNGNFFTLMTDEIKRFEKRKNRQLSEFENGERYLIFNPEKKPGFIPPITKEDIVFETIAPCSKRFEEILRQKIILRQDHQQFNELKNKIDSFLTDIKDDSQLKRYTIRQLQECQLTENDLEARKQNFARKEMLFNEIMQSFEQDHQLKSDFLQYISTAQYLSFYKSYLAWAFHASACTYHAHIQTETENENRLKKIEAFKAHFSSIVHINADGAVPNLFQFKRAFSQLSLEDIAKKINSFLRQECNTTYFHSSDKQKILVKNINEIAADIASILNSYDLNLNFAPFNAWEKGWVGLSAAGFKWEKAAEELEKKHHKTLQDIISIAETDPKYAELTTLYSESEHAFLINFEKSNEIFWKRIEQKRENLKYKREDKKLISIKKATELQTQSFEKIEAIKALALSLDNQSLLSTIIANETEINSLHHQIAECPLEKIQVNVTSRKKQRSDLIDTNLTSLTKLNDTLGKLLIEVQTNHRKTFLNKAITDANQAKKIGNDALSSSYKALQKIQDNYRILKLNNLESITIDGRHCENLQALEAMLREAELQNKRIQVLHDDINGIKPLPIHDCFEFRDQLDEKCKQFQPNLTLVQSIQAKLKHHDVAIAKFTAIKTTEDRILKIKTRLKNLAELASDIALKSKKEEVIALERVAHIQKLEVKLGQIKQDLLQKSIEHVDADAFTSYLSNQNTALDHTIKSMHTEHQCLEETDRELNLATTIAKAETVMKDSIQAYVFTQKITPRFYQYILSSMPQLADELPPNGIDQMKQCTLNQINIELEKINLKLQEISSCDPKQASEVNVFNACLQQKLQIIESRYTAICTIEHNFLIKLHSESLSQAKSIEKFLLERLRGLNDLRSDPLLIDLHKRFNTLRLQLKTISQEKINRSELTHLAKLNANIIAINDVLIELHQAYKAMQERQESIIAERRRQVQKHHIEEEIAQQNARAKRNRNIKIAIGASLFATFTVASVLSGGLVALVSSPVWATVILLTSTGAGAAMGAASGYYADKLTSPSNKKNALQRFVSHHHDALKWAGVAAFSLLTIASLAVLTAVSFGIVPAVIATLGVATAASISAITGASISTGFAAIMSCSVFAGLNVLAAGALIASPKPTAGKPVVMPNSVNENENNGTQADLSLQTQEDITTDRSTHLIQKNLQEEGSHLVTVERAVKSGFLKKETLIEPSSNEQAQDERVLAEESQQQIKHSRSQNSFFLQRLSQQVVPDFTKKSASLPRNFGF